MKRLTLLGIAGLTLACSAPAAQACWDGAGYGNSGYTYAPRTWGYGYRPYYSYGYGPRRWAYGYAPYYRGGDYFGVGIGFW